MLIGVDNGGDYNMASPSIMHSYYQIFREQKLVLLGVDAQAPGHHVCFFGWMSVFPFVSCHLLSLSFFCHIVTMLFVEAFCMAP